MLKIYLSVICLMILIAFYSCKPSMYTPTDSLVNTSATLETLTEGRSIYMNKCGECHRLHRPSQYSSSEWRHNVDKMQKRAHISDTEKEMVYQYLISYPKKKSN